MWKWIVSPRRVASEWVAGIVRREFADRERQSAAAINQMTQAYSALASARIRLPVEPKKGRDGLQSKP